MKFELKLIKSYLLNPRTRHLEFSIANNHHLKFKAGQFISLHFKNHSIPESTELVRRNFSIANTPSYTANTFNLEIAATFIANGIASTKLWEMKIDEHIQASGPFGIFTLHPEDLVRTRRYILVATGTGVTPYRAMLENLQHLLTLHDLTVTLLLGVRNREELLYGNEFIDFAKKQPKFSFTACYSRETNFSDPNPYESIGYVQNKLTQLNINPEHDLIYLCGNPNMIDESVTTLQSLGVPKSKIRREKYISSK